jgi:hypothetical protein
VAVGARGGGQPVQGVSGALAFLKNLKKQLFNIIQDYCSYLISILSEYNSRN